MKMNKKIMVSILLAAVVLGSLNAVSLDEAKQTACSYARVKANKVTFTSAEEDTSDNQDVYRLAFTDNDINWQIAVDKESGDVVKDSFQEQLPQLANGQKTISEDKATYIAVNEVPGDSSNFYGFSTDVKKYKGTDCWRISFNDGDETSYSVYVNMVNGKVLNTESF